MNQSDLAKKAGTSRSTVINAEDEKTQVRFSTVQLLLNAMGYGQDSNEMRELALLWLEGETGVRFAGMSDALRARHMMISSEQVRNSDLLESLSNAVAENALTPSQIQLLIWATSRSPALEILDYARQLEHGSDSNSSLQLLGAVAEEQALYDAGPKPGKSRR